jgi:hypothetical protein
MNILKYALATVIFTSATAAIAADASERKFIREGMHESEIILKIGKPDHETFIKNERGQPEEKSWSYFPHSRDSQTLTIITLRGGVIAKIERKISR